MPKTESGLLELDDLRGIMHFTKNIKEAVHKEIIDFLVKKYSKDFILKFNKKEIHKEVKERMVEIMADRGLRNSVFNE